MLLAVHVEREITFPDVMIHYAMLMCDLRKLDLATVAAISFRDRLLQTLKDKFEPWSKTEVMALYLNPLAHSLLKKLEVEFPTITEHMREGEMLVAEWYAKNLEASGSQSPTPAPPTFPTMVNRSDIYKSIASWAAMAVDDTRVNEPQIFKSLCMIFKGDLLEFWRLYGNQLPILTTLSRYIWSIPSSQASSERAFSSLRSVLTDSRMNLSDVTLNKILVTKDYVCRFHKLHAHETNEISQTEIQAILGDGEHAYDQDYEPSDGEAIDDADLWLEYEDVPIEDATARNVAPRLSAAQAGPSASSTTRGARYGTRKESPTLILTRSSTEDRIFATFRNLAPRTPVTWDLLRSALGEKSVFYQPERIMGCTIQVLSGGRTKVRFGLFIGTETSRLSYTALIG